MKKGMSDTAHLTVIMDGREAIETAWKAVKIPVISGKVPTHI